MGAELAVGLAVAGALAAPHALPLGRVAPGRAAAIWLAALTLRALVVLAVALTALAALPESTPFDSLATATLHDALPFLSDHVTLSGDPFAHALVLLPSAILLLPLVAFCVRTGRASYALQRWIARRGLGSGPHGSMVVADPNVVVAVPVLGTGRPIVSHAALASLDDAELSATIAHELGHLHRGHRPLRLLGAVLARAAVALPGTRAAERGLWLSLERDADEYAVRRTGDPLGLASGICKAAAGPGAGAAVLAVADGGGTGVRIEQLLAGGRQRSSRLCETVALMLSGALVVACAGAAVAIVTWLAPLPAVAEGVALALACSG